MNYYFRNNETDFIKWYRHIVPFALVQLKVYENDILKLVFHDDEYHDILVIKKQLYSIKALLDKEHLDFFENSLLKKNLPKWSNKESWALYDDIYLCWQRVCFPEGKNRIKELDPVLLGGELKRLRLLRGIRIKQAAEIVGISAKALYAYECGTREMKASTFYKLCQIYKKDINSVVDAICKKSNKTG